MEKGEFLVPNLNKLENFSSDTRYYASFKGITGGFTRNGNWASHKIRKKTTNLPGGPGANCLQTKKIDP